VQTFVQTKTEKLKSQQREYEAQMQYRQHLQDFVDRWRYNAKRASQAQSRLKILEKLPELRPLVAESEVVLRFPEVDKLSPPILQLSEISFGYGKQVVFKNMNINADMESRIALVGENGTGKTTLVKLLTGELSPREGYRQAHR
jgi:ATP-binding cassette subfamily F protein 3